jgi:uncharacterized protein YaaR (DUF327 family)
MQAQEASKTSKTVVKAAVRRRYFFATIATNKGDISKVRIYKTLVANFISIAEGKILCTDPKLKAKPLRRTEHRVI